MFQTFADNADRLGCAGMMSSGLLLTLAIVYVAGGSCGCCLRNGGFLLSYGYINAENNDALVLGCPSFRQAKVFFPQVGETLQTPQP